MAYYPGQFVSIETSVAQGYGDTCYDCACDGDEDVPATVVIVGETDSFGSEFWPLCEKHHQATIAKKDKALEEELENPSGYCEWCKTSNVFTFPRRDFEEGSSGRLYDVCNKCIDKENDQIRRELG